MVEVADVLLMTLRCYATGTFKLACADLCDLLQASAGLVIKRVSEAVAAEATLYKDGNGIQQTKVDFW